MPEVGHPKHVRFREFLRRLGLAPLVGSRDEARQQIDDTLIAVEDEMSGVPNNPDAWRTDGRMYPVQDDHAADVEGHPGVLALRSRGHETFLGENGAYEIQDVRTGAVLFQKPGLDGKGVWP